MGIFPMADLFCGAGGTSTGASEALSALGYDVSLTAINHWDVAVATHTANHPNARHLCASLDSLNPKDLFSPNELQLLWASPECTHHSIARGGKPINDQSRSTAWCVTRWAEALQPPVILIENVPEFVTWGPCGSNGKPLQSRRGDTFRAWIKSIESVGYKVDYRILCAADYGDPTTRRRLFVQAVRGRRRIVWPNPTHSVNSLAGDLFTQTIPWKSTKDHVIDWSIKSQSIFSRKRPLKPKTLKRIEAGLEKFGGKPFLAILRGTGTVHDINKPTCTVTASGGHLGLCEPFVLGQQSGSAPRSVNDPLPTISTAGAIALIEPFIIPMEHGGGRLRSLAEPMPTITTARGGAIGLCEPFITKYYGSGAGATSISDPIPTVTVKDRFALVEPDQFNMDIRFRMLQPHELAAAQGFRKDYVFTGTKTEQVKQIGNAVPRGLSRALVLAAVGQNADISKYERE